MNGQPRRRARGREINGILLLDKPAGLSSNQALQRAKRLFDARKAGHTGSLDVLATGLLPVCFGSATKVCQFLLDADKLPRRIHVRAPDVDRRCRREVLAECAVDGLDAAQVARAMRAFTGWIEQIPPMHSALKRTGSRCTSWRTAVSWSAGRATRAHRRLRTGVVHEPACRGRHHLFQGTYVRTLAEDLGAALGCGAYMSALRRHAAGPYQLARA